MTNPFRATGPQRPRRPNPMRPALVGLGIIGAFVAFFLVWGFTAPVAGAAVAEGSLQVRGERQSVQHAYGGVVAELRVTEGQKVEKGQVLMKLSDQDPRAKRDVLITQRDALLAQEGRLVAERDGSESPAFGPTLTDRKSDPNVAQALSN